MLLLAKDLKLLVTAPTEAASVTGTVASALTTTLPAVNVVLKEQRGSKQFASVLSPSGTAAWSMDSRVPCSVTSSETLVTGTSWMYSPTFSGVNGGSGGKAGSGDDGGGEGLGGEGATDSHAASTRCDQIGSGLCGSSSSRAA